MHPRLATLPRSVSSPTRSVYICSTCRSRRWSPIGPRRINTTLSLPINLHVSRRRYSSTVSTTAINAKKPIPAAFQELHASLRDLEEEASIYISPSQLQLALRGLESENAVTRVAVLGVGGQRGARRLARVLLADPLRPEAEWEKQLVDGDEADGKGLLLRYRAKQDFDKRHPLLQTLSIPAPSLLAHNLEILIQDIPETSDIRADEEAEAETFLVPYLQLNSPAGRISTGNFPVHRSVIYARGLQNVSTVLPKLSARMIKGVVDAPWNNLQEVARADQALSPINLALAESAIDNFRRSLENGLEYEHGWFDSGLASVSAWFFDGLDTKPNKLKPSQRQLITTICMNTERAIIRDEALDSENRAMAAIHPATRDSLNQDVASWAEFAHTELRSQLEFWFGSRDWKKLAWWKLIWRVDDISSITSHVLQRAWLVEAEKEMIWLTGRLEQAGLGDPEEPLRRPAVMPEPSKPKFGDPPEVPLISELVAQMIRDKNRDTPPFENIQRPWPQDISRARATLSVNTIPALQALAQRLLVQTISTTILTSSLSALIYMSLSSPSLYESGTVAAVGFVYSLCRLQGRWRLARERWEDNIRAEGIRLLRELEAKMSTMVKEGGRLSADEEREEQRTIAKNCVENVRKVLEELDE